MNSLKIFSLYSFVNCLGRSTYSSKNWVWILTKGTHDWIGFVCIIFFIKMSRYQMLCKDILNCIAIISIIVLVWITFFLGIFFWRLATLRFWLEVVLNFKPIPTHMRGKENEKIYHASVKDSFPLVVILFSLIFGIIVICDTFSIPFLIIDYNFWKLFIYCSLYQRWWVLFS